MLVIVNALIIIIYIYIITMESKTLPQFFTDHLLFSSICEYLIARQVLSLATLNHQMHEIVEQHCRIVLKELHLRPSSRKSSIHQMQFYFNRCLRIVRHDKNMSQNNENLITIHQPFKFETIKFFQVGSKISCYLTRNQKARIFRTSQLLELYEQNGQVKKQKRTIKPKYLSRNGIRDIKSKSDQCVITKTNGQVTLLTLNKNQQQLISVEQLIVWTTSIPIQSVANSYGYSIFIPESLTSLKTALLQVFNKINKKVQSQSNKQQNQNKIYLIGRNMINYKQFLIQVPCAEILDTCVGSKYAYFISNKNQLFQADLQEKFDPELPIIKARVFQHFKGINIVKISSGYNFFVALQRNLQQLQQWDTQRVVKWLRQIGFQAYIKIARYQKLDGNKLKTIQRKYMHNVLGITTQNMQQKFIMSIEQNMNKKSNNDQLWGWGKNQSGQLGSSSAVFISKPQKIRMNCLNQGQYIDSIFCAWFQTYVRTQKGRIYCTLIKSSKKRKGSQTQKQARVQQSQQQQTKVIVMSDDQEDIQKQVEKPSRKKSKTNQNHGKKKKKSHQQSHNNQISKQKSNQKYKQQQNWEEFGLGKAFFIQVFKDILFIIQCPVQQKEQPMKIVKLRTAKAILDKILWSDLNKEQYKVGYMDKDMGLIEASAIDMQKFQVKQNSIKYFKRGNTILWDRNNKTDFF